MKTADLPFREGQARVPLTDGTMLSILTQERDVVIAEAASWHPGAHYARTRANDEAGTYEVALVTASDGSCAGAIPEWEPYRVHDDEEGWVTYGYVPAAVIENYLARVGTP